VCDRAVAQTSQTRVSGVSRWREDPRIALDTLVSAGDFAGAAASLPFHSVLLPICLRSDRKVRVPQGRMARRQANRALPPTPPGRVRSGSLNENACFFLVCVKGVSF